MKIVIHAGAYKTATSGLQIYLQSRRDFMLSSYGILYPRAGSRRNFGALNKDSVAHNLLFHISKSSAQNLEDAARRRRLEEIGDQLCQEVAESGAESVLVSAEKLSLTSESEKRRFLRVFERLRNPEFWIVYSLRHFADFVESMANQSLKNPLKRKAADAVWMDGTAMLRDVRHWRRLVGPERLTTLYFDPADHAGFCEEMLRTLGCDGRLAAELEGVKDNTSASLNNIRVSRLLARIIEARELELDRHTRNVILESLSKLELTWEIRKKAVTLPQQTAIELSNLFASMRDEIAGYLTPPSLRRLEADLNRRANRVPPVSNVDHPVTLSDNDVLELVLFTHRIPELRALIVEFLGRLADERKRPRRSRHQ
jgi:hypothetical protein